MTQAFAGIRIIDFTQVLAGPYGVMQLALLGAEVIKIEHPKGGDQTRGLMSLSDGESMSPSFMTCNLNKRSLTLDLKSEAGVDIIKQLIPTADAIVENFKAGTMKRMGLGYEQITHLNPSIIYCSVTGYGQTGSKAGEAAYDGAIQASSGMMSQTGHPETGPTRTGYMPVDMSTALNTAFALSAALYRKKMTGEGQRLDVAMMDTAIVAQAAQYSNYLNQGSLVGLIGNASPTKQPTANVFPSSDGHVQITALRQPHVEKFFAALNISDALSDPDLATPDARVKNAEKVHQIICQATRTQSTDMWIEKLKAVGIPVAQVRELPEVIKDEQFKHRGVFEKIPSPVKPGEDISVIKAGYIANADGPDITKGPPTLGQDTDAVLTELGYSSEDIDRLRKEKVI